MPRIDAFALGRQGPRPTMEDRHVLSVTNQTAWGAVFDGHRGDEVAAYAAAALPSLFNLSAVDAMRQLEAGARRLPSGACAVVFRLDGAELHVANLGDCELAVVRDGHTAVVTEMHRVTNQRERQRVLDAGGVIDGPYVMDLASGNGLMPTRTLGDTDFEAVGVSGEVAGWSGTLEDGWIVAACDGLWDVMKPDELPAFLEGSTPEQAARRLVDEALGVRFSHDNVTVLILRRTPS
ncbi:MAG: protein serine/threonine phosphatase 2C family protein [Candidatus Dormibacteraeota bacterium]|nr:protein serine/threonine phosphatase 2C family protein [Candidatus Dormibacteraeota bacterium]